MNLYGLIGYPLGHSFSKKYITDKFDNEGITDSFFELFPIQNITHFPQLIKSQPSLKGLAVTIPYKQEVMPYLQSINGHAMQVGAVNCIKVLPTEMIGYNTDIIGFEKSFAHLLQSHHKKALVFGTGGASKAVQYVLNKLFIPFLNVSRTPSGTKISYSEINNSLLKEYTILINCTPAGMEPNEDSMPALPYHFITAEHYLYDLIYQPAKTKFLHLGEINGATIKNGYEMLIIQAEENWKIWKDTTV